MPLITDLILYMYIDNITRKSGQKTIYERIILYHRKGDGHADYTPTQYADRRRAVTPATTGTPVQPASVGGRTPHPARVDLGVGTWEAHPHRSGYALSILQTAPMLHGLPHRPDR